MDTTQIVDETNQRLQVAAEHFADELKKVRTGRANAAMLDGMMVEAYGAPMPLNQVATIAVPEPQLLQLTPFDPNNLPAVASAIRDNQSLGLNPSDDGRVVRVPIPALTEERRRDIAKQLGERVENCMITMRTIRHDGLRAADQAKKDKQISEDDARRIEKQIDEAMAAAKQTVDQLAKAKEAEILTL